MCVSVCIYKYVHMGVSAYRSQRGNRGSPGAGAVGGCELPDSEFGEQNSGPLQEANALNGWAVSTALSPQPHIIKRK